MQFVITLAALFGALALALPQAGTPDGTCGGSNAFICNVGAYGGCCSSNGYCGSSTAHCGAGCQSQFSTTACIATPPSIDGGCGPTNGNTTCAGGEFDGQCCSQYGFCGTGPTYCSTLAGCQSQFGAACTTP